MAKRARKIAPKPVPDDLDDEEADHEDTTAPALPEGQPVLPEALPIT